MAKKNEGNAATLIEEEPGTVKAATLDRREQTGEKSPPAPVLIPPSKGVELPVQKFPRLVVMHDGKRYGGFLNEMKAREFIRSRPGAKIEVEFVDENGYPIGDAAESHRRMRAEEAAILARAEYEREQARQAIGQEKDSGSDGKSAITPRRVIQQLLDTLQGMGGEVKFRYLSPVGQPGRHEALPGASVQDQEKITLEIIYRMDK